MKHSYPKQRAKLMLPLLLLLILLSAEWIQAQNMIIDMHNYGSMRAFHSRNTTDYSVWELVEHDCSVSYSDEMIGAFSEMSKHSQAHFEALMEGKVGIAFVSFETFERPFFSNSLMKAEKYVGTYSCLTGIVPEAAAPYIRDRDYFKDFVDYYHYLKNQSRFPYTSLDGTYSFRIIDSRSSLREVMQSESELGIVLSLTGGHLLGHSVFIENDLTETPDYQKVVMKNILRLKGSYPLIDNTSELLSEPVIYVKLASNFRNGICGSARTFPDSQEKIFKGTSAYNHIDGNFETFGKKVVQALLSRANGRRILIDISGMSLASRRQYYDFRNQLNKPDDNIPIIATHVGISGKSWDDPVYLTEDNKTKNKDSYLNHWMANLSKEDIITIHESNGLIGLQINPQALCGDLAIEEANLTIPGTRQHREVYVESVMANILMIVSSVNEKSAWDMITIGSNFDNIKPVIPMYQTAENLPDLRKDIYNFLKAPGDVFELFPAAEVNRLMFGHSPQEIVNKIFTANALSFLEENLPENALAKNNDE